MDDQPRGLADKVVEEVRVLLTRRRYSARQAAFALGWTEHYMSRRMTGKVPFDVDDLEALAKLLNVQVTAFFAGLDHVSGGDGGDMVMRAVNITSPPPIPADQPRPRPPMPMAA